MGSKELQEELKTRDKIIEILRQQNADLLKRIETIEKSTIGQPSGSTQSVQIIYETDEEELTEETEYIVKRDRRNKKRKASSSPMTPEKQPILSVLDKQQDTLSRTKIKKDLPPPPITVEKCNYDTLYNALTSNNICFKATLLNSGETKINTKNEEQYRKTVTMLKDQGLTWYTYENKQTRQIKVMAKRIHPTCNPDKIMNNLKDQGFNIVSVSNMLKRGTKTPLPLFMLTFDNGENINKIYSIKEILGINVYIEPVRKSKLIPQCKRCQRFGHTQTYCNKNPRCVKCAGNHLTADCTQPKDDKNPKCINCGGKHPASYRGCIVAKEMQTLRNSAEKKTNTASKHIKPVNEPPRTTMEKPRPGSTFIQSTSEQTYAQITRANAETRNSTNQEDSLIETIQKILQKMNQLDEKIETISARVSKIETNTTKIDAYKRN